MVSHLGLIYRNDAAQTRIDAALAAIAASGTVTIPPMPDRTRDGKYNETLRMEWIAEALEAIAASTSKRPKPATKKAGE